MPEDCRYEPDLSALLDGELGEPDRGVVLAHLEHCGPCGLELDQLRRVRTQLRSLPARNVPEELFGALATARTAVEGRRRRRHAERLAIGGMLVAAAVAGAAAWGGADQPARTAEVPVDAFVSDHLVRTSAGPLLTPLVPQE